MESEILKTFYENHNRIQQRVNRVLDLTLEPVKNREKITETWESICNMSHFNFLNLQRAYETSTNMTPIAREIYANHLINYGLMVQQDLEYLQSLKEKL